MVRKSFLWIMLLYILGPLPLIAVSYVSDKIYFEGYGLASLATGVTAYTWLILCLIFRTKLISPDAVNSHRHLPLFQAFIAAAAVLLVSAHKLFLDNVFQADIRTLLGNIALLSACVATVTAFVFMINGSKTLQRIRLRMVNMKIGKYGVKTVLNNIVLLTAIIVFIHVLFSHSARNPWAATLYSLYFAAGSFFFFYNKRRHGSKKHDAVNETEEPAVITPAPNAAQAPVRRFTATLILPVFAAVAMLCSAAIFVKVELIINKLNSLMAYEPPPVTVAGTEGIDSKVKLDHALVVITFDDGNKSDYEVAYPILKKYGIRGTSFINPYFSDNHVENKLSWKEIKQMAADGWEFGDHTYIHMALGSSTEDKIRRSMELVNNVFRRNGIDTPEAMAYPYGDFNPGVIDIVRQYRKQGRLASAESDIVDLNNLNPYQIRSASADMLTINILKSKELLVDKACEDKTVLVLRAHCMFRDKLNDMGNQPAQTSSELFEQLVKYCVNKGCEFTTMHGLYDLFTQ